MGIELYMQRDNRAVACGKYFPRLMGWSMAGDEDTSTDAIRARTLWGLCRDAGMDIMALAPDSYSVAHNNTELWDLVEFIDNPIRQGDFVATLVAMRFDTEEGCRAWVLEMLAFLRLHAEMGHGYRIGI